MTRDTHAGDRSRYSRVCEVLTRLESRVWIRELLETAWSFRYSEGADRYLKKRRRSPDFALFVNNGSTVRRLYGFQFFFLFFFFRYVRLRLHFEKQWEIDPRNSYISNAKHARILQPLSTNSHNRRWRTHDEWWWRWQWHDDEQWDENNCLAMMMCATRDVSNKIRSDEIQARFVERLKCMGTARN